MYLALRCIKFFHKILIMNIVCLDLEGVLIPEIWINFAEKVGVEELKATTRDIPDYDELMKFRLDLCTKHNFRHHSKALKRFLINYALIIS